MEMKDLPPGMKYCRPTAQGKAFWMTKRLWELAQNLPVKQVSIDAIPEFDQDFWCNDHRQPTLRNSAEDFKRVMEADLSYPIILSADGGLMDGAHRLFKAWLAGQTEIAAVQFQTDPEPDYFVTSPPDVSG